MSTPFIGEIRMFGGGFAPRDWAFCNGQLLSIAQNAALFALIGTTFGGDGVTTFALPNLQSRLPIGEGQGPGLSNRVIGQASGSENVTLTQATMPGHSHLLNATTAAATTPDVGPQVLPGTVTAPATMYTVNDGTSPPPTPQVLGPGSVTPSGGNQAHSNLMPSLCVSFIISMQGIFPSRN
jgi:microcystin-dependent protein